ncbi:MAG: hypothetical protein ABIX01_20480 [Chitinophagaceae bacterium]
MIDTILMTEIGEIANDDFEYTDDIERLYDESVRYLNSHNWCDKVVQGWLAASWGYLVCIFFFKIGPSLESNADTEVWVVAGDLPTAYIDIESASSVNEVLEGYVFLMKDWIEHVQNGKPVTECYPISIEPTIEYAGMLSSRIQIIEDDFIERK